MESLAAGGDGVARLPDGRTLFVELAAPGDRVRVRLLELRSRFARGRILRVLESGPDRVEPPCPAFGECGGCSWQHVRYPAQLRAKAAILRDALERIGKLRCPDPLPFRPSPAPYGYRLRSRLRVSDRQVGYRRRRSHRLCAVRSCPVLEPALERALSRLADDVQAGRVADGEVELVVGRRGPARRRLEEGGGSGPAIEIEAEGRLLRISAGVFAQGNRGLLDVLAAAVRRAVSAGGSREDGLLVELFAGAGFFTVSCAPLFPAAIAVESSAPAAADLRFNLDRSGLSHVEVRRRDSEAALAELGRAGLRPSVVLLDPPRAGLGRGGCERLVEAAPARVVYLSCDPATLARDLAWLCDGGFALRGVEGFDLFPQTPHVEALAVLERAGPGSGC